MNRNDALNRIEKLIRSANDLLKVATDLANDHSIGFVWKGAPFEAKYNGSTERWTVGDSYWNDSGCTIDYEEFDNSWASSSIDC
jgi:hypothetical protein